MSISHNHYELLLYFHNSPYVPNFKSDKLLSI